MFSLLLRGNIADGRRHQDSFGALQRTEHDFDGELASILPQGDQLNPGADLLGQRLGRRAGSVRDQPLRKPLRNDAGHLLAQKFIAAVAKLFLRQGIQ